MPTSTQFECFVRGAQLQSLTKEHHAPIMSCAHSDPPHSSSPPDRPRDMHGTLAPRPKCHAGRACATHVRRGTRNVSGGDEECQAGDEECVRRGRGMCQAGTRNDACEACTDAWRKGPKAAHAGYPEPHRSAREHLLVAALIVFDQQLAALRSCGFDGAVVFESIPGFPHSLESNPLFGRSRDLLLLVF